MSHQPGNTARESAEVLTDAAGRPVVVVAAAPRQTVWWVMTVLLSVIATALVLRWDESAMSRMAWAQAPLAGGGPGSGSRGIYAFTGQIGSKNFGLFMLDVDSGTVWCYEIERGRQDEPRLKLIAARSWLFDRYLEEFNVAAPTPTEVRQLVEQQKIGRQAQQQWQESPQTTAPSDTENPGTGEVVTPP